MRPTRLLAAALACLLTGACADAGEPDDAGPRATAEPGQRTTTTTAAPEEPTGVLVAAEPATFREGDSVFAGLRIRYQTESVAGALVEVTGLVGIPEGEPPAGGWPIVAWAHGTTGVADACAPSTSGVVPNAAVIKAIVDAGYVVAATDYEGLGGPGVHPYLHGLSEARSVAGSVAAAVEAVDAPLEDRWVAAGHSQGGHAAIFTAELGPDAVPGLTLAGSVAVAPAAGLPAFPALQSRPAAAFVALLLAGFLEAVPAVDPASVLTDFGLAAIEHARAGCLADVFATATTDDLLLPGSADPGTPLAGYLEANDAGQVATAVPILVTQGDADNVIPVGLTDGTVQRLCGLGDAVDYRVYPGADHGTVLVAGGADALAWIAERIAGAPAQSTC